MELGKGLAKMGTVGLVTWLILQGEWDKLPSLMNVPMTTTWEYWGEITEYLFWAVSGLLLAVAAADFSYNLFQLEKKMKMTKQEVKEEHKRRETDPHLKGRRQRMAREMINRQMLVQTQEATAIITNPTHFSVAIKYETGMQAPIVIAKGVDFLALRIREVAKEYDIPIVENKPLARTLYKLVKVGDHIPETLYLAVSEVIKYVFKKRGVNFKGKKIKRRDEA